MSTPFKMKGPTFFRSALKHTKYVEGVNQDEGKIERFKTDKVDTQHDVLYGEGHKKHEVEGEEGESAAPFTEMIEPIMGMIGSFGGGQGGGSDGESKGGTPSPDSLGSKMKTGLDLFK